MYIYTVYIYHKVLEAKIYSCGESVESAVVTVMLIRPQILTSESHCGLTLRPPEVDQTSNMAAPLQDSRVQRHVEQLRINASTEILVRQS